MLAPRDTVATLLKPAVRGEEIVLSDGRRVTARADADIYFKIAAVAVACGSPVIKYGHPIGVATEDIEVGDVVHVHNLRSGRAQGSS